MDDGGRLYNDNSNQNNIFNDSSMTKIFTSRNLLIFLTLSSIFALIFAYISQYVFGLQPCELCFWQRKPFFAIIILSAIFLTIPQLKKFQNLAIKISLLLLLINSAIAFYHAGVEKKVFKGLSSCASNLENITKIEDLKLALEKTKSVRCDKPQFVLLGISMAGWNFIYCLGLAIISFVFLF